MPRPPRSGGPGGETTDLGPVGAEEGGRRRTVVRYRHRHCRARVRADGPGPGAAAAAAVQDPNELPGGGRVVKALAAMVRRLKRLEEGAEVDREGPVPGACGGRQWERGAGGGGGAGPRR